MSCEVCIGNPDGDRAAMARRDRPIARVPHVCSECNGVIPKGRKYERVRGKWDRKWEVFDTCETCEEIRNVFSCGEGYVHTMLWEDMAEMAFPRLTTATDCFQELSPAAKAVVLSRWRQWRGL